MLMVVAMVMVPMFTIMSMLVAMAVAGLVLMAMGGGFFTVLDGTQSRLRLVSASAMATH
jgi:hypothetical protein